MCEGVWCGAMCVRVWDDVEWAEEEDGEGDGGRACLHVHWVVGCGWPSMCVVRGLAMVVGVHE